jgi:hypothetical protein
MGYELNNAAIEQIAIASAEFKTGKRVVLESLCRLAITLRTVRLESLAIPAANRPKLETIKETIRIAFGGNSKETDRAAYDQCSLAFRLAAKAEKVADQAFGEFTAKGDVVRFADELTLWAGDNSVVAIKAWIVSDRPKAAPKSAFDRIKAAVEGKAAEFTPAQLAELAALIAAATVAANERAALKAAA